MRIEPRSRIAVRRIVGAMMIAAVAVAVVSQVALAGGLGPLDSHCPYYANHCQQAGNCPNGYIWHCKHCSCDPCYQYPPCTVLSNSYYCQWTNPYPGQPECW